MSFLIFQLWAAFGIAVFSLIYYMLFRKETFYLFNRFYLVSTAILSMTLPAIHFEPFQSVKGILPVTLKSVTIMASKVYLPGIQTKDTFHFLPLVYLIIALLLTFYFIFQISGVLFIVRRNNIRRVDDHKLILLTKGKHTFSFFNLIFIPPGISPGNEYNQVVCHELAHMKQLHSIDILLFKIIKVLQWFNPFVYLMETLLKETHEYLADEAVLKQDSNADQYRLLLLSQVFGIKPGLFSFFNHSLIKNRLIMMTKQKSPPRSRLKYLVILPFLALVIMVVCCTKNEPLAPLPPPPPPPPEALASSAEVPEVSYVFVEKQAKFQGGDISTFRDWLQTKLVYPPEAIKKGVSGKVTVQFSIDSKGKLSEYMVLKSPDPLLSEAAIAALKLTPDWTPAQSNNKVVNQQFVIPVYFMLK
jgi:TonB family protein